MCKQTQFPEEGSVSNTEIRQTLRIVFVVQVNQVILEELECSRQMFNLLPIKDICFLFLLLFLRHEITITSEDLKYF